MEYQINADSRNTKSLYTILRKIDPQISASCNGNGTCGQCRVWIDGIGSRLACQYIPKTTLTIHWLPTTPTAIESTVAFEGVVPSGHVLVDLGTTTIALATVSKTVLLPNPCIPYGLDVMSRIQSSMDGAAPHMCQLLRQTLVSQIHALVPQQSCEVYVAGNTTMLHLLLGYPLDGLSQAPFTPFSKNAQTYQDGDITFHTAPCISAFLGGDYLMGLLALEQNPPQGAYLFADFGTNGEIALFHQGTIYGCSVATGPALEGGCLSCGCASIPGAIYQVTLGGSRALCRTKGNKLPVGLCGEGAVSLFYECKRKGYVTKDGTLTPRFPAEGILLGRSLTGELRFTPNDYSQLQNALASMEAGITCLLSHAGIELNSLAHTYVAGGLGNVTYPFLPHATFIGNSCLSGLAKWASTRALTTIPDVHVISLAEDPVYREAFLASMKH